MWPGAAAVVISKVWVYRGPWHTKCRLDGKTCESISAFLFDKGGDAEPEALAENATLGYQGSIPLGMGFTFDDNDKKGVATPVSTMNELISSDARNNERIFPFIGYAEVANDPRHAHHRYIIDFGERSLAEASAWPDLLRIVEQKVRPAREENQRNAIARRRAEYWWQYGSAAKELYGAIRSMPHVLVTGAQAAAQYAFAFLPSRMARLRHHLRTWARKT